MVHPHGSNRSCVSCVLPGVLLLQHRGDTPANYQFKPSTLPLGAEKQSSNLKEILFHDGKVFHLLSKFYTKVSEPPNLGCGNQNEIFGDMFPRRERETYLKNSNGKKKKI